MQSHRVRLWVAAGCVATASACSTFAKGGPGISFPLVVSNHTDFEVVVYAMPSSTGTGIRIGNARSFTTMTMTVPRNALQSGDRLVLRLHSIGSNVPSWISPSTPLDSGVVAQLEIRADPNGSLTRSTLFVTDSGGRMRETGLAK
jgi:hypothetical protein